jgi:hypothetical protein
LNKQGKDSTEAFNRAFAESRAAPTAGESASGTTPVEAGTRGYPFRTQQASAKFPTLPENTTGFAPESGPGYTPPEKRGIFDKSGKPIDPNQIPPPRSAGTGQGGGGAFPFKLPATAEWPADKEKRLAEEQASGKRTPLPPLPDHYEEDKKKLGPNTRISKTGPNAGKPYNVDMSDEERANDAKSVAYLKQRYEAMKAGKKGDKWGTANDDMPPEQAKMDRALAPIGTSGVSPGAEEASTINNSGNNRNVNVNSTNNVTVNGHSGESPGQTAARYSGAQRRIYGDMQRDLKVNMA